MLRQPVRYKCQFTSKSNLVHILASNSGCVYLLSIFLSNPQHSSIESTHVNEERFYLLAAIITGAEAIGVFTHLPLAVRIIMLTDLYSLAVNLIYKRHISMPYVMVVVGLVLSSLVLLMPPIEMMTPMQLLATQGLRSWGQSLFIAGGGFISAGAILHAWTGRRNPLVGLGLRSLMKISVPSSSPPRMHEFAVH